jgi:hypothetical protein
MNHYKKNDNSAIVAGLTLAAMALPGLIPDAKAGRAEETYNADFQYGNYAESSDRIYVDTFDLAASAPIGKAMTGSLSVVRDTISGASPIYNAKENGKTVQMVSGASRNADNSDCGKSICDQRDGITGGLSYFFEQSSLAIGGGFSQERDYTSRYVNTNFSMDFNKKLTTLNLGAALAFDEINPTERPGGFVRNRDCGELCSKTTQQYLLGVSQIIDKNSLIQNNMTFSYNTGYLSDPYKKVAVFDGDVFTNLLNDTRPREKFQWAWLTQYVRHFGDLNGAALHADYRFTTDDWGINTHTAEFSWHQPIAAGWQVIPRFRYYSQDQADFYRAIASSDSAATVYSSDYRLAGFGTLSGGLKLSKELSGLKHLHDAKFQVGAEFYDHSASYEIGGNRLGNFADFSYYLFTASFNLKF